MKVQLGELLKAIKYIREINQCELKDIRWIAGDTEILIDKKDIEEWGFIGLNNIDFAKEKLLNKELV
jgi:hypothetical protein